MSIFSKSFITKSRENTILKSEYFKKILVSVKFHYSRTTWAACKKWILLSSNTITYITKVSKYLSNTILSNFPLLMSSTQWVVGKISSVVYFFQVNLPTLNLILVLLKERKNISKTILMLLSANKKIFSKNQSLSGLSWMKNDVVAIL